MNFLNCFKKKEKVLYKVNISFEYYNSEASYVFKDLIKPLGFKEYKGSSRFDNLDIKFITRQYEFDELYDYFIFYVESQEMREFLYNLEIHLKIQYKLSNEDLQRKQDKRDELLIQYYNKSGAGRR